MKSIVIDASVAIKWFIPEIHAIQASFILEKSLKLIAPDLVFAEIGSILWKKCRLKELELNIAYEILNDFKKLPFQYYKNEILIDSAWQIATKYQCTIYDSLYVALAQHEECPLITADRALYNILQKTPLNSLLVWVEDSKKIK